MMKKLLLTTMLSLSILGLTFGQTSLALGDIAFTSYNSDGTGIPVGTGDDAFTFVLLVDVAASTTITFTENGWLPAGGFRTGESTCTFTFGQAYTCGSQITISATPFQALDETASSAGAMTGSGLALATGGDQIFAYQGAAPTAGDQSNFIAAIHMNCVAPCDAANWDSGGSTSTTTSGKPSVFTSGVNAIWLGATESDNAQYNCSTEGNDAATIRTAVNNPANWNLENTTPYAQPPSCTFTCALLAMELQNFTGESAGVNNELHWTTASEVNTKNFIVERSVDGYEFETIGQITAAGNSQIAQNYEFTDYRVIADLSYYRLVEINQNGIEAIASDVIAIKRQSESFINLAPNPTKGNISLSFTAENRGNYEVLIYDLLGKEVSRNIIEAQTGLNQVETETKQLNTGMYLLQISNEKTIIYTEKFIKE